MGRAIVSKSLIQFSVDDWSCVPSLLFTWGQTMVKVMKIMVTSFKRSHACTATHPTLQCPLACSRSPPTHASAGSWCSQGLFEPSEHLWQERGLILNANLPLLPSCWLFSIALGHGVSPHSHSSTYCATGVSLTLDVGYLLMAGPAKRSHCS